MIKCPNCGGGLRFDIPSQMMICRMCDSSFDPAAIDNEEKDNAEGVQVFESYIYTCPSCGGELLGVDKTDAIGYCPFCGGASMLFDRINKTWRPEYIIPFTVTKEQCRELYLKEAKRSPFTDRRYCDPALIEGFRGIYMPYWCYKGEHKGPFTLTGSKKGVFTGKDYKLTGDIDLTLDGYAHDASIAFDDRISESLAPFDASGQKPFVPGYLAGFYADAGDVDRETYLKMGTDCMRKATAKAMAEDDTVNPVQGLGRIHIDTDNAILPTRVTGAYRTLYPVWFMSYRDKKDKLTYAAVNGQTGKVSADLPQSPVKIAIAVLILAVILAAGLFLLPSAKANAALFISTALLLAGTGILRFNYRAVVNSDTHLDQTDEAKRFDKRDKRRMVLIIMSAVAGAMMAFADLAHNYVTYIAALVLGAELFYMMFCHIRFQIDIARRRPPQFDKKGGAEYDEN